jgi:hypothetical protein
VDVNYAVQLPDDVDTVDVRYPQTRPSAMTGFPDLCNGTLGISPLLLDLISGAIYWCLAWVALDWVRFLRQELAATVILGNCSSCIVVDHTSH